MSENRDEILANFQSITGIEDIGEAFSHLEQANWDLMTAITRVLPQDVVPPPMVPSFEENNEALPKPFVSNPPTSRSPTNNFSPNSEFSHWIAHSRQSSTNSFGPAASTSADSDIIDLTSDIDLGSSKYTNDVNNLKFNIHFNHNVYTLRLPRSSTIDHLKNKIRDLTKVPKCRQALRGWPPAKMEEAQRSTTILSSLDLSNENELVLNDLTEEGFMDFENDVITNRLEKTFTLNIAERPSGRQHQLQFPGHTIILDVKTKVFYISDIPVRHQEWTGWPLGCNDQSTLAQSGIESHHNFLLRSLAGESNHAANNRNVNVTGLETDSSADEFEDASDFNNSEEFFTDARPLQPTERNLISNNIDNELNGTLEFVRKYVERFGEPHPTFYTGSLENALRDACHKPAKERKLLAIYLHHGGSILTNVFCDPIMKHESIIQTFGSNFVLYGWDLTYESNKNLLLSSVTACISNTASVTIRNISHDKLPAIMIIGKSRLSGRSSCEVLSVIHGNVSLEDLLTRLLESVEMYNQHLRVEIREDEESAARALVKAEQDMAYQATLEADMAKEAEKRQKEAAIAAERKRLESEKAEEDEKRESIRLVAEQSLPAEPEEMEKNVAKIRVRKPTGDFLERRFFLNNTLQDLLNFVASNGFFIEEYKLISSWPRRDLTSVESTQTFESLKLFPQETVILEER